MRRTRAATTRRPRASRGAHPVVAGVVAGAVLALALACGSAGSGDRSGADGPAPGDPGAPGAPGAPGEADPSSRPPIVRRDFPLEVPSLGGFALVKAFASADLAVPAAIVWPKPVGAPPFVLERMGIVKRLANGGSEAVLDFSGEVGMVSEAGALGLALHPEFGDGTGPKPYAYVWYNANGGTQRLARFTWDAKSDAFDRASELVMLDQAETRSEHNGGHIEFGPDGFLYFGNGDDIDSRNHQRLDRALFAGIFRIDVDMRGGAVSHPPPRAPEGGASAGYYIPNDNPFVGVPGALEEYYALGMRNPFGFSFDRQTGDLWAGDVGDTWREEVDLVLPGGNYQWPMREGDKVRDARATTIGTAHGPKYVYTHASMADLTAILGGYVYRGKALPELSGTYVYSDWPSGRIWALDLSTSPATRITLIDAASERAPLALGEDRDGELYVLFLGGAAKLVRDPSKSLRKVPRTLTETKLFRTVADVASLTPAPELVPYEVSSPLWSDAAAKRRFVSVPAGEAIEIREDGTLSIPAGTIFMKQFDLPPSVAPAGRSRRLETRVLVVGSRTTYGLTYRWNVQGTDADLVTEPIDEAIVDGATKKTRRWHFPSLGECWSCHRSENRVLGFTLPELTAKDASGARQLDVLAKRGVFAEAPEDGLPAPLAPPGDPSASNEARATAYLAANCSACHHPGASFLGGEETWNARPSVPLADRGLVGARHHNRPMAVALGLGEAPLIDPGHPERSVLLARMRSIDADLQMPPLGRTIPDPVGVKAVEDWIRSMPAR